VILEPRNHPKLQVVLENAHKHMPLTWDLYVFHGPSATKAANDAVVNIQGTRKVFLKSIGVDNMSAVEYNRKFNFLQYGDYMKHKHVENSITSIFISLLFEQHPIFENMKNELIITTSKSSIMTTHGINGEGNWHKDNILFPIEKENNLIISWNGNGTSCLSKTESDTITSLANEFIEQQRSDYHNYPSPHTYPINPISSYYSKNSNEMKILSMNGKTIFHRRNPLYESDIGDIRYVLNIYY
jgi:hypothetical protein